MAQDTSAMTAYDVKKFGATGDGKTKDTRAVQQAIEAAARAGGGTVFVPAGDFVCGTITLRDNVTLHLDAGATIWASTDVKDFDPPHLIFARDAKNIGITGKGRIHGNGDKYRVPPAEPPETLHPSPYLQSRIYYWPPVARPNSVIELVCCKDVTIQDITLEEPFNWTLHLFACDRAMIRGITLDTDFRGPNSDGLDIDGCRDVIISDCWIHTADDAICLKNTGRYGIKRLSRNITVTNCVLSTICYGFKTGTESQEGFEDITFSNSVIYNETPEMPHAVGGIALGTVDGGNIAGVTVTNIVMRNVLSPILLRTGNLGRGQTVKKSGSLRGVNISNIVATGAHLPSAVAGIPDEHIEDVMLSDFQVFAHGGGTAADAAAEVPEMENRYRFLTDYYHLVKGRDWTTYGFYCLHVNGLRMRNMMFKYDKPDARPAMILDDVKNLDLDGFWAKPPAGSEPVLRMTGVRRAMLRGCRAEEKTGTFLKLLGPSTERITVTTSDLTDAAKAFDVAKDVPREALFETGNRGVK